MILCGLLREGRGCYDELAKSGLVSGDFYDDTRRRAYDLFCYVAAGLTGWNGVMLIEVYEEVRRRRERFDQFGEPAAYYWLACVYTTDCWLSGQKDMRYWAAEGPDCGKPYHTWAALAAAAKVRHLAARRAAYYAAMETIRDATDPAGGADELFGRAEYWG